MKNIAKYIVIWMAIFLFLLSPLIEQPSVSAAVGEDFPVYGKDTARSRYINDPTLVPPIQLKGRLKIGWSVSQTLAVGDFFYAVAAVPNTDNLFSLKRGTYLYKIPIDFEFIKGSMTKSEIVQMLTSKGAKVTKLGDYRKSYSHPTYASSTGKFYVGISHPSGGQIIALNSDLKHLRSFTIPSGKTIVGPPTLLKDDLVAIGAFDGKVYVVNGLALNSGPYQVKHFVASSASNAEISGAVTRISSTDFVFGYNKRSQSAPTAVYRLKATVGKNGVPSINQIWRTATDNGIPSNVVYDIGTKPNYLYFTSKYGHVYKYKMNGTRVVKRRISNVTLINNSPAIDGSNLYIPVRSPGKIVSYRKSDMAHQITAKQGRDRRGNKVDSGISVGAQVANDITIWHENGNNRIFYGDTKNQLTFLTTAGDRTPVAIDYSDSSSLRSSIRGPGDSGIPSDWQVQGTGIATEPLLAKQHLAFGINKGGATNETGELWIYSVGLGEDVFVKSVEGGTYKKNEQILTPVVVGSKEPTNKPLNAVVRLYRNNRLIGNKRVTIQPGELQTVLFPWTYPQPSTGTLKATINLPKEFPEVTFANNTKISNYKIEGDSSQVLACQPGENNLSGVSRKEVSCDEYGCYTIVYYEYLKEKSSPSYPSKIRAGYGFSFDSYTMYIDEASQYKGPKKSEVDIEGMPSDHIENSFELEKHEENVQWFPYTETVTWKMPKVFVEKYSGEMFRDPSDSRRSPKDTLIDGGHKWYTNFEEKDGTYYYKVVASGAGKNNLSSCNMYPFTIEGTPFDDFIRRDVYPTRPFLDEKGPGFNWKGKEGSIHELDPFYKGESSEYEEKVDLDSRKINKLKEQPNDKLSKESAENFGE